MYDMIVQCTMYDVIVQCTMCDVIVQCTHAKTISLDAAQCHTQVLLLGCTVGWSRRKGTTSLATRPAKTRRSWRGPASSRSCGEWAKPAFQFCSFSSRQMLTYSCHIWVCHRANVHKIVARLHISRPMLQTYPPTSPSHDITPECSAMKCTLHNVGLG